MQDAICFFSVNAKSNPRGWAKSVIGSAPCCFRGLVSVSNDAMLEERPHGTGDTVIEAVTWMCVSRECGLSPLYLSFVLFLFFITPPPFQKGSLVSLLYSFLFPLCFSMKSLVCHQILAIVHNSIVSADVAQ